MFFRLKKRVGNHVQNGKTYKSGDVIETEKDLTIKLGHKFELVHETDVKDTGKKTKPNIETPSDDDKEKTSTSKSKSSSEDALKKKYGKEVTKNFPAADDIGVLVFEKSKTNGKWYTVVDPDNGSVLNKKNLRKAKVNGFIESITEED